MHAPLTDPPRGDLPVLLALVAVIAAVRIVCRRPALRCPSFAAGAEKRLAG